jgi:hypothetical protein
MYLRGESMKVKSPTYRETKRLANKLEKFIQYKKGHTLNLSKREIEIMTITKYIYENDKECQEDKVCQYMYDLTMQTFNKIERDIDNFIKELKA